MTTNLVSLLATILLLLSSTSFANDIRINQVGDDFDLDISQDGTDNKIKGMAGATSTASVYGNDAKLDLTQTGNNNTISMYYNNDSGGISTPKAIVTQTGNRNTVTSDQHGFAHESTVTQTGDDNTAWVETGRSSSHLYNQFSVTQTGDNINAYLEQDGSYNTMETEQRCSTGSNCLTQDMRIVVTGNSNSVKAKQGVHYNNNTGATTYDGTEPGGNDMDVDVTGSNNSLMISQRNQNSIRTHNMDVDITGDYNDVFHTQAGDADKTSTLTINNDNNAVEHVQTGNGYHTSTITLGGTGATTFTGLQGGNSSRTYTLNQSCVNTNGCTVTVTQQ